MKNQEVINILTQYSAEYGSNCFWNKGLIESQLSASEWGITNQKCSETHCTSNKFGNAIQCYGYSLFVAYVIFGDKLWYNTIESAADGTALTGGWKIFKSNLSSVTIEPGDIIRTNGHSAMVHNVNSDGTFTVTECWGSKDYGCPIKWGNFNGRTANKYISTVLSAAIYVLKAPKTYKIKNVGSNKYLSVMSGTAYNEARVIQLTSNSTDSQKWLTNSYFGQEKIITALDHDLSIKYDESSTDIHCRIYNTSENVCLVNSGSYRKIQSADGSQFLSADASGSNVYWTSGDSTAYQKWSFEEI